MRVYYLKFTKSDFAALLSNQWQSPIVDLYDNGQYANYSAVKSTYGVQTQPGQWASGKQYTWVGLTSVDGRMDGQRFVDYSAPINIVQYTLLTGTPYQGSVTLDLRTAPTNSGYPDEWVSTLGLAQVDGINFDGSDRYAQFNLNFDIYPGDDAVLYIRVEVGPPVIAPKYRTTQEVLNVFPKWMAIREYDYEINPPATPQIASPTSLGGGILNSISGEWLEELKGRLTSGSLDMYIDTVNTNQMAWAYKVNKVPQFLVSIVGDGHQIGRVWDVSEFYEAESTDYVAWWDEDNQTLYLNQNYGVILLNGSPYSAQPVQVWNSLDELGLLADLKRLHLEGNISFQHRIKDVFINPLGVGKNSFKLALRRELNLWSLYGSTPDSSYLGATPEVLEMSDLENPAEGYTQIDGLPTSKFIQLADSLAKNYPTTWGYFKFDNALWDISGPNFEGFNVLPRALDATQLDCDDTQAGVGGGDDLLVFRPDQPTGPHEFTASIQLRGKFREPNTEFPPANFQISVIGQGNRTVYNNPATSVWFTVAVTATDGAATPTLTNYYATTQISSTSDVELFRTSPSPASYGSVDIITPTGIFNPNLPLQLLSSGAYVTTTLSAQLITSITVHAGKYDWGTSTYTGVPGSNTFDAWLSNATGSNLTFSSSPITQAGPLQRMTLQMLSKVTSSSSSTWQSNPVVIPVAINNTPNITSTQNAVIPIPPINWDAYVTTGQEYIVTILTNNGAATPVYGADVYGYNGNNFFIDDSYIYLNGSNAWSVNTLTVAYGTSDLTFSLGSGAEYPSSGQLWIPFTSSTVTATGTVDENGPWVNGIAPDEGIGNNVVWFTADLNRTDFGIPNTANYIVNWIGITTDDDEVVAWTDTSTIVPVVNDGNVTYPPNAIVETLQSGVYAFSPFTVFARLIPQSSIAWNPQVHSGTFFECQDEYYLYASPGEETATANTKVLSNVSRQGAPIIVRTSAATPTYLRQVCFFDDSATPDPAAPTQLSITNSEVLIGTGTNILFASYPDIYSITVSNVTIPYAPVSVPLSSTSSADNQIHTVSSTVYGDKYKVSYILNNSFYADNSYTSSDGSEHTYLVFNGPPPSSTHYIIDYETSAFNVATPVPIPLNPLYTSVDEGFIFISHDEYDFASVVSSMNPHKILANGEDYTTITVRSVDVYGNPKPNQTFALVTNYGTLAANTLTTDQEGYASTELIAAATPATDPVEWPIDTVTLLPIGTVTITGESINNNVHFLIEPIEAPSANIYAVAGQDEIPADLRTQQYVYGKLFDADFNPLSGVAVDWAKARSNYQLFNTPAESGTVTSGADGSFTIGPFTSATPSGYWFVSTAAAPSSTVVGDVVFWYEYPAASFGVDNMRGLPPLPVQMATPIGVIPPYLYGGGFFPVNYDEDVLSPTSPTGDPSVFTPGPRPSSPYPAPYVNPDNPGTAPQLNWVPPQWYPLPGYTQYQLGLIYRDEEHPTQGDV